MNIHSLFNWLVARWNADTPKIHKYIIRVSACIFSVSSYVMATLVANNARIPLWFDKVYPIIIIVTSLFAGYSKFQKDNNDEQ